MHKFEDIINKAWEDREQINKKANENILDAIKETINLVDNGKIRVAEKKITNG